VYELKGHRRWASNGAAGVKEACNWIASLGDLLVLATRSQTLLFPFHALAVLLYVLSVKMGDFAS